MATRREEHPTAPTDGMYADASNKCKPNPLVRADNPLVRVDNPLVRADNPLVRVDNPRMELPLVRDNGCNNGTTY